MQIKRNDIIIAKNHNGEIDGLFIDPLFFLTLENYFELLEGDGWNVLEITSADYINSVLDNNAEKSACKILRCNRDPVKAIQSAIKQVHTSSPYYKEYLATGNKPIIHKQAPKILYGDVAVDDVDFKTEFDKELSALKQKINEIETKRDEREGYGRHFNYQYWTLKLARANDDLTVGQVSLSDK